ncbi:transposase domain-containing protein [Paraburkholderia sp. BCC1884]|nr:transposase domain-containing protein [Paraburkholderia sp. BCC1884]
MIDTAKLNDVYLEIYLHRAFARLANHPLNRVEDLTP